jgi:hypothetical protein
VKKDTANAPADVTDDRLLDNWFDPIETELRTKVRGFIAAMIEEELETALARPRNILDEAKTTVEKIVTVDFSKSRRGHLTLPSLIPAIDSPTIYRR